MIVAANLSLYICRIFAEDLAENRCRPNVVLILTDDLGFADLGCYGSEIATPNLDRLAAEGLRFTQFYNAARCCPTRAALLTGLYPHQAGIGHMLQAWHPPAYTAGLNEHCATFAQLLGAAGYRNYHVGKWHVGGVGKPDAPNHPLQRGFDHCYGGGADGNYFRPGALFMDREKFRPDDSYYSTDMFSNWAVKLIEDHRQQHGDQPYLLHVCYTAPHFPLQAKPADIAKYRGKYLAGWDTVREQRFQKQRALGIVDPAWKLSPPDPVTQAWKDVPADQRDEWDLRMAVYAAMIDCLDQGVGRILDAIRRTGREDDTLVMFLSDNGASAEFLDSWPKPARGHKPGSITGTPDSHRCLEIGWASVANTPFREHKMWTHEGGIATPCIARWPRGKIQPGSLSREVGHVIDFMPTFLELAGTTYPAQLGDQPLIPLEGRSLLPALQGKSLGPRTLAWEHEGNRALRSGDWKVVADFQGGWELYDLARDRTETQDLASADPGRTKTLAAEWQKWAERVGVVAWGELPGGSYKPTPGYRKKSEPVAAEAAR